jgi:hypothetical protein
MRYYIVDRWGTRAFDDGDDIAARRAFDQADIDARFYKNDLLIAWKPGAVPPHLPPAQQRVDEQWVWLTNRFLDAR